MIHGNDGILKMHLPTCSFSVGNFAFGGAKFEGFTVLIEYKSAMVGVWGIIGNDNWCELLDANSYCSELKRLC